MSLFLSIWSQFAMQALTCCVLLFAGIVIEGRFFGKSKKPFPDYQSINQFISGKHGPYCAPKMRTLAN